MSTRAIAALAAARPGPSRRTLQSAGADATRHELPEPISRRAGLDGRDRARGTRGAHGHSHRRVAREAFRRPGSWLPPRCSRRSCACMPTRGRPRPRDRSPRPQDSPRTTSTDASPSLGAHDLVLQDKDGRTISGAYPFTERATGHAVTFLRPAPVTLNTMCIIDALGAGAMCRERRSSARYCRACGAPARRPGGGPRPHLGRC